MKTLLIIIFFLFAININAQVVSLRPYWNTVPGGGGGVTCALPNSFLNYEKYNGLGYGSISGTVTIKHRKFTNNNSGIQGGVSLLINSSVNIVIDSCFFDISYHQAIKVVGGSNLTIKNSLFANNNVGMRIDNMTGNVKIQNNQFLNMKGHTIPPNDYHKGQLIQLALCTGAGNEISGNLGDNYFGECYNQDLINMYGCTGTSGSPFLISNNRLRGGSPSASGGGIITGDGAGSYQTIDGNKILNGGQYGVGVGGGTNMIIKNNWVYSDQWRWTNIGIFALNFSASPCNLTIENNNRSRWICGFYRDQPDALVPGQCCPGNCVTVPEDECDVCVVGSNNTYFLGSSCACGSCFGPSGVTLAEMLPFFPTHLLTLITEDEVWQLRSSTLQQSLIVQEAITTSPGDGKPPQPIDLTRPTANFSNQNTATTSATLTSTSTPSISSVNGSTNTLIGYRWVFVCGPATPTIVSSTSASTNVTGLSAVGQYFFRLEVTQNNNQFGYDTYQAKWGTITKAGA